MASPLHLHQPWITTLKTSKPFSPRPPPNSHTKPHPFIRLSSSSNPTPNSDEEDSKSDRVSLAFNKALEYKKSLRSQKGADFQPPNPSGKGDAKNRISGFGLDDEEKEQKTVSESIAQLEKGKAESEVKGQKSAGDVGDGKDEIPDAVRVAMEKAKEYRKNKGTASNIEPGNLDVKLPGEAGDGNDEIPDAVRVAMEKAKEYRKNKVTASSIEPGNLDVKLPGDESSNKDVSEALRIAMEKAEEYKKNKGTVSSGESNEGNVKSLGPSEGSNIDAAIENLKEKFGKKELKISKMDFIGLDFSDKKERRGLPPGLFPVPDPYMGKELPEVEFIAGDPSKFANDASSELDTAQEDTPDLYKPKVSTWGVFPRPNNISKAFGGGKTIRPGEVLESEEVKAAKEARTKQLLAEYKAKLGLNINPKLKEECDKAMKDGDELMDVGKLKDALPYYQQVMEQMTFQTELHGLAALQWAICLDSLSRSDEAQVMYRKLQSHPNALVSKKARQFIFSFEAMDMLKVKRSPPRNPGYQTYFDAFVEEKPNLPKLTSQEPEPEAAAVSETFPYIVFLVLPVLIVLLIAANHGM